MTNIEDWSGICKAEYAKNLEQQHLSPAAQNRNKRNIFPNRSLVHVYSSFMCVADHHSECRIDLPRPLLSFIVLYPSFFLRSSSS